MGIVAINIKEVNGKVLKPIVGKINIRIEPKVNEIRETKARIGDKEVDAFILSSSLLIEYLDEEEKDKKGYIEMKGEILYQIENKEEKEDEIKVKAYNYLMRKGVFVLLPLCNALSLPPFITLPKFELKEKK